MEAVKKVELIKYTCANCGLVFRRSSSLTNHNYWAHNKGALQSPKFRAAPDTATKRPRLGQEASELSQNHESEGEGSWN